MTVTGVRLPYVTIAWTIRGDYLYVSNLDGIAPAIDQVEKERPPQFLKTRTSRAVFTSLPAKKGIAMTYSDPAQTLPRTSTTSSWNISRWPGS